jgi:hypothetical protein
MSDQSTESDFSKLQTLLRLKRHEQPPPRYFNDLPGQVIARIKSGERGSRSDGTDQVPSWLEKLWSTLEAKSMTPALLGVAGCVVVAAILLFPDHPAPLPASGLLGNTRAATDPAEALTGSEPGLGIALANSTNPTAVMPVSLFDTGPALKTLPASGTSIR